MGSIRPRDQIGATHQARIQSQSGQKLEHTRQQAISQAQRQHGVGTLLAWGITPQAEQWQRQPSGQSQIEFGGQIPPAHERAVCAAALTAAVDQLVEQAAHPRIVAIGETGLDYYRLSGDLEWQRQRFRTHIRASRASGKPLIIHTRAASEDTLRIMKEEKAGTGDGGVAGVMHCFTESQAVATAAMDMGFYISFSGIVTFKNAKDLQAVAREVPLERMLIETDSPYLAPVPMRGKTNEPGFVRHVAEFLADLKGVSLQTLAESTTRNFRTLFRVQ